MMKCRSPKLMTSGRVRVGNDCFLEGSSHLEFDHASVSTWTTQMGLLSFFFFFRGEVGHKVEKADLGGLGSAYDQDEIPK